MTDDLKERLRVAAGPGSVNLYARALARIEEMEARVAVVRPLVWPDFRAGGTCGRPYAFQYFVTQDHAGNYWTHFDDQKFGTLVAAKDHCEAHWQRTMVTTTSAATVRAEAVAGAMQAAADILAAYGELSEEDLDDGIRWQPAFPLSVAAEIRKATPADATAALDRIRAEAWNVAIREAAKAVAKRRDSYVAEHGRYDPSTGITEFPGNGEETVEEWDDTEAAILALIKEPKA